MVNPLRVAISVTLNTPFVSVPVLSITTVWREVSASRKLAPFTRMPWRDAEPMPPKYPRGIDITSAHGHDMTSSTKARYVHSENAAPGIIRGGTIAIPAAANVTSGV